LRQYAKARSKPGSARSSLKRRDIETNQGQNTIRIIPVDSGEWRVTTGAAHSQRDQLTPASNYGDEQYQGFSDW